MEYSIDVSNVTTPTLTTPITGDWFTQTSPTYYTYSYTTTVYMYQLICPKCNTTNWGEVDRVITCKGKVKRSVCGAKLKAVKDVVDYEIPVG